MSKITFEVFSLVDEDVINEYIADGYKIEQYVPYVYKTPEGWIETIMHAVMTKVMPDEE